MKVASSQLNFSGGDLLQIRHEQAPLLQQQTTTNQPVNSENTSGDQAENTQAVRVPLHLLSKVF